MRVQLVKISKGAKAGEQITGSLTVKTCAQNSEKHQNIQVRVKQSRQTTDIVDVTILQREEVTVKLLVHFFWMEVMEYGTEGQAISPRRAEVGDFYPPVLVGDALTPLEQ